MPVVNPGMYRHWVDLDDPVVDGTPCGVFRWRPPARLVVDLSDALDQAPDDSRGLRSAGLDGERRLA